MVSNWSPGITIRTYDYETALYYKKCYDEGAAIKVLGMTAVVRSFEIDIPMGNPPQVSWLRTDYTTMPRCTIELQQVFEVRTASGREMDRPEYRSAG